MTSDRALAVILGRGGSKGLPGKNAAIVGGRECVRWTIDDARSARVVGRIGLSTDDAALQAIGFESGIDVIARPADLASDAATVDAAARHAVQALGDPAEIIVILYANVPLRPKGLIDRAVRTLVETGADSAQSYAPVGKHHPWWTARVGADGDLVRPWEGEALNHGVFRRQDLPPAVIPDGGVIAVTRAALFLEVVGVDPKSPHAFFGKDRRGVLTAEGEVVDIDSRIDLLVADALLREREGAAVAGAAR
ncbi:MAG: acylneuraminate cytidylyltransferase family protein [Planctomycetota bacterium]|nr:acylneuraminate cytidylyltransferase family protein [Planctomycetota bacterium]